MTAPSTVDRRKRRNALLLAGLVPSACAVVLAVALLLMVGRNVSGQAALAAGDHDAAAGDFAANRWFGTVEHWVAPYNEGVATARAERFAEALEDFTAALDVAPPERECLVLHNIAVVQEQVGDRAGDALDAVDSYREARAALASASCLDRVDAGAHLRADSVALDTRLRDKIDDLLAEQDRRERERLTPTEQRRADLLEEGDRRAEQRDQTNGVTELPPDPGEDYAW